LLFVFAVVATPPRAVPAFVLFAVCVGIVAHLARVRLGFITRRLVFEIPFLAFALLIPFLSSGERVSILGLSLSEPWLWAARNIAIKATLGLAVTV
jgi:cobalt/nickel transport system permease protein